MKSTKSGGSPYPLWLGAASDYCQRKYGNPEKEILFS